MSFAVMNHSKGAAPRSVCQSDIIYLASRIIAGPSRSSLLHYHYIPRYCHVSTVDASLDPKKSPGAKQIPPCMGKPLCVMMLSRLPPFLYMPRSRALHGDAEGELALYKLAVTNV